jgi:hypothetical protein
MTFDTNDHEILEVIVPNLLSLKVSNQSYSESSILHTRHVISGTIITPHLQDLCLARMDCTSALGFMSKPKTWGTADSESRYPLLQSLKLVDIFNDLDEFEDVCDGYMEELTSATPGINHLMLLDRGTAINARFMLRFLRDHDMGPTTESSILQPQLHTITTNTRDFELLHEIILGRIKIGRASRKLYLSVYTPFDELTWFWDRMDVELRSDEDMFE